MFYDPRTPSLLHVCVYARGGSKMMKMISTGNHRRSQGCTGYTERKIGVIGVSCKCTSGRGKSQFLRKFLLGEGGLEGGSG